MLGLLKRLFGKPDAGTSPSRADAVAGWNYSQPTAPPPPPPIPIPSGTSFVPRAAPATIAVTDALLTAEHRSDPLASTESPPLPLAPLPPGPTIEMPWSVVLPQMPESLRGRSAHLGPALQLPLALVLPQLAAGTVRFSSGELRTIMPPDFFAAGNGDEAFAVELPLAEVLRQLKPEHLVRRPGQRRIEVPDEVTGIFTSGGRKIINARVAAPEPPRPAMTSPPAPAPALRMADPSMPTQEPIKANRALANLSLPSPDRAVRSSPASAPSESGNLRPAAAEGVSLSARPPLRLPIADLSGNWPNEVIQDIAQANLTNGFVDLPLDSLEHALKTGHILFPWKCLAAWLHPPLPNPPTPATGEMLVELPLKVLAPAFLAQSRLSAGRAKVVVDETIPDLFKAGTPSRTTNNGVVAHTAPPATAPLAEPRPVAIPPGRGPESPLSVPQPTPVAAPPPKAAETPMDLAAVLGSPGRRLSPKLIVQNAAKIPGLSGALLAMSDGLLVASALPSQIRGETMAAFLPQIFGRMHQYASELKVGELQGLVLQTSDGRWHLFKLTQMYFVGFSRPGEEPSSRDLRLLAAELNRLTQ